jgi:hypothetical protein
MIDFTQSRLRWHKHIGSWSNWSKAVLRRRGTGDRPCVACVVEYSPKERQGATINPEDRKAMLSALVDNATVLVPDPDQEQDVLIVFNPDGSEQPPYRMVAKPGRAEPTPGLTLFWTLQVRR